MSEFAETKKCVTCGKKVNITYPRQWAYKRAKPNGTHYFFCSWSCLRAWDDKKGRNEMNLSKEQRQNAIDMALRGESPLKYIEGCGINNPSCTWWNIKKNMSKNDPATYAKLPERFKCKTASKQVETPEGEFIPAAQAFENIKAAVEALPQVKVNGPLRIETETPEQVKVEKSRPKIESPATIDGFVIYGIEGQFGRYMVNEKVNYFDFLPHGGEMCMSPEDWKKQISELNRAMKVLGVSL